jgi:hypothetical protein
LIEGSSGYQVNSRVFIGDLRGPLSIEPDQQIAPYDKTLRGAPAADKKAWTDRVWTDLKQRITPLDLIIITAGEDYCHYLFPLLWERGCYVQRPLQGLGMGLQPGRLRQLTAASKAERTGEERQHE